MSQAELERINQDLVQKNAELDEFTYVASHDLQEPVRKMISFSGMLLEDLGGDLTERVERTPRRADLGGVGPRQGGALPVYDQTARRKPREMSRLPRGSRPWDGVSRDDTVCKIGYLGRM